MITKIVKLSIFVGLVLFLGQVRVEGKTIGERFVTGLDTSAKWTKKQFTGESFLSGFEFPKFELPKFLKSWTKKKEMVQATQAEVVEDLTEDDQEKLLHLLN